MEICDIKSELSLGRRTCVAWDCFKVQGKLLIKKTDSAIVLH